MYFSICLLDYACIDYPLCKLGNSAMVERAANSRNDSGTYNDYHFSTRPKSTNTNDYFLCTIGCWCWNFRGKVYWINMNDLKKVVLNGHMLKNTGSWLYCDKCNKTIGYLCYTTYQDFDFKFHCKCGNSGSFHLEYKTKNKASDSSIELEKKKNRLCCPNDGSPLFTIVEKNIENCSYTVVCNKCYSKFSKGIEI